MRKFSKTLYSKEALLKAAYAFTDSYYVHLDEDEKEYCVTLFSKEDNNVIDEPDAYLKYENELIAQQTRLVVSKRSKNIREMIVARALSSTMIGKIPNVEIADSENEDSLMRDWFERNNT